MFNRMGLIAVLAAGAVTAIPIFTGHSSAEAVLVFVLTLGLITLGLVTTAIVKMGRPVPEEKTIRNHIHASGTCTSVAIVAVGVAIATGIF